jgi:plasmid stability protein
MASLTLKNLPEDLVRALRVAAEKDRRSLTQEIIYLLDTALRERGERPVSRVEAQVTAWRKLAGKWESDVDRATEIERIIKQRTPGRGVDF